MNKRDLAAGISTALIISGIVAVGNRSTYAARPGGTPNPAPTVAPSPATVDQLIAHNSALAALPRAILQQRLAHPVQSTPPPAPDALQALAQSQPHHYSDGLLAIQPTTKVQAGDLSAAAYDSADVARYFAQNTSRYWVAGAPGAGQVLRMQFLTAAQVVALHPAIGMIDRPPASLICYVELGGPVLQDVPSQFVPVSTPAAPFHNTVAGTPPQSLPTPTGTIPSATIIFDAQTGNVLERI